MSGVHRIGRGTATINNGDGTFSEDVEVMIEAIANGLVLLRRKGKSQVEMVAEEFITNFARLQAEPAAPIEFKQRSLPPTTKSRVQRHLLDYHGTNLLWINSNPVDAAFEYHATLDHTDTGHNHNKVENQASSVDE